jgi:lysophospholipase L1-like esterase
MSGRRLKVTALGSSFAAGPGIEPIVDKVAMRSSQNYAHQLAERLDADLTDLTVSGATLLNVLDEAQQARQEHFEPQLDRLPKDADIVTLTGGGNDIGYSSGMVYDSALSWTGPLQGLLRLQWAHPFTSVDGQQLTERFIQIIDRIRKIAPNAKVYLVEYLSVFGDATKTGYGTPLTGEQIQQYRDKSVILAEAYENAVQRRPGVELVPMSKESQGHEIGTAEPWMAGFALSMLWLGVMPYHPNLAGHKAVTDSLYRRITSDAARGTG